MFVGEGMEMATKGKNRDMIRIIRADGWRLIKSNAGDHRQYKHPVKPGRVTVSGKLGDDVDPKRWKSMLRQAGLEK